MKKTKGCICEQTFDLDGELHVEWPDPDCPRHGLGDKTQSHQLAKYRQCRKHGLTNCRHRHEPSGYPTCWGGSDYETVREVQQRLYREGVAA